ncbi:diguanylate cyclase (GGDEF) domain-containing protein [Paenibacillus sophorae]|uniref:Diguanylate cyclase (GGDEF) domain-containing protein n=1 Tax=Paenibacillus sophorae TaxID=1333845 RepID=A0A1H8K507_9BACL|nr:sensor domain-containing diguanylate cyclase [Paenibacillus sophorae]QWU13609.1 sensor domain-containing diguanylate cyclase [Paenibacillus sophorae]SEN87925.1 diguanylate cyclase (GGDEF) domain-containing protein [Paenibacillus sophorae]
MSINLRTIFAGAFAAVIILLTVLLSYLIGNESSKTAEVTNGKSLAEAAYQMSYSLDHFMWTRAGEVEVLSKLDAFQEPVDEEEIAELLNQLKESLPVFTWIGYADTKGNILSATGEIQEGSSLEEQPVFQNGIKSPYIGDVHDGAFLAEILPNPSGERLQFVDIGVPVKDKSGRSLGVLAAHLSWEWARQVESSILTPLEERVEGAEVYVISNNDIILLGPSGQVGKQMSDPALRLARQGKNSWLNEEHKGSQSYLTGYAYGDGEMDYPGLGWSVIIRQPADIALASVRKLQNNIVLMGMAVAVLFGIAGWLLAGWIIRPLQRITESADLLSSGGEAEIPEFNRIKDLSILSRSLRNLVNKLTRVEPEPFYMSDMTRHDPLTGLPNRTALDDYLAHAVNKAKRNRSTLSFLYLGLDGFKKVNETLGHKTGDKLLQEVSFRLLESTRENEMITRIGGDEFVVILHTSAAKPMQEAEVVAKRIIDKINQPFVIDGEIVHVGCSIGAAVWSPENQDTSEILRLADDAHYISKRSGKNRITFETAV